MEIKKIIINADYIDKGPKIRETIEFIYKNWKNDYFILVKGNHENFVYNYLKGVKAYLQTDQEVIDNYFNTIGILENDELLKNKFFELVENSREFYIHEDFVVTHSPCDRVFIGKLDGYSLKQQRNFRYPRLREYDTREEYLKAFKGCFKFFEEQAQINLPKHVTGHVAIKKTVKLKNKYMIDTGCASGGYLTSVIVNPNGKPFIKEVKSKQESDGKELVHLFDSKKKAIDLATLTPYELKRIEFLIKNKVNFISGTMSPVDKDDAIGLEPLETGLKYYAELGVKSVTLQPKHMGSRCNVYLFKDIEKSYLITRNGYLIKENMIPKEKQIEILKPLHDNLFLGDKLELIILDAELLPWNALGDGLIHNHFIPYGVAIQSETETLKDFGFFDQIESIQNSEGYNTYLTTMAETSKEDIIVKIGRTNEKNYRNLKKFNFIDLKTEEESYNRFMDQMNLYASDGDLHIEPFSILKARYKDGTEELTGEHQNSVLYETVSNRSYAVIDLENNRGVIYGPNNPVDNLTSRQEIKIDNAIQCGKKFYQIVTQDLKMEGIVIKPDDKLWHEESEKPIPPYLKVRNENYLTLVYGYNFRSEKKYAKLMKQKGIRNKLRLSIDEFDLGMRMLKVPYSSITEDNEEYKQMLAQMIIDIKKEDRLDPRL